MNFGPLSKKAVSYSSPSITMYSPLPILKLELKSFNIPPIIKDGSMPATCRICAMIEEVVVFPWVPVTRIIFLSFAINMFTAWGMERYLIPLCNTDLASTLSFVIALPIITRSRL